MSEDRIRLLNAEVLSPVVLGLRVLPSESQGDCIIGYQAQAIGTEQEIKEKFGESVLPTVSLVDHLKEYSRMIFHKQLERSADYQNREIAYQQLQEKFPIGSVVKLKSGGPKMTVESVSRHTINTVFYLDNREIMKQEFVPEVLEFALEKKEPVGSIDLSVPNNNINLRS